MRPYIIGIAGASCSGKSSLAELTKSLLEPREAVIVAVDSYYFDLSHLPFEERARHNFDSPDSIDFDLLLEQLRLLTAGEEILIPRYRFDTHTRAPRQDWIAQRVGMRGAKRPIIIIEGLHTFYRSDIRDLIDMKIFVDLDMLTSYSRRKERDVMERGRRAGDVRRQFYDTVAPMFEEYILPAKQFADIVIDGVAPMNESAARIFEKVLTAIDRVL